MRIFLSLYTWRCGLGVRCQYLLHCFWMRQFVSPDAVSCFPVSIYLRFQSSIASTAVLTGQDSSPCPLGLQSLLGGLGRGAGCVGRSKLLRCRMRFIGRRDKYDELLCSSVLNCKSCMVDFKKLLYLCRHKRTSHETECRNLPIVDFLCDEPVLRLLSAPCLPIRSSMPCGACW